MILMKFNNLVQSEALVCIGRCNNFNNITLRFSKEFLGLEEHTTISEYPGADHFVDLQKQDISDLHSDGWLAVRNAISFEEVILKDRLLRNIRYLEAKELVVKVAKYFYELYSKNQFKVLVVHPVDNYVMDVMVRLAERFNIAVYGVCAFFVGGYKRVSVFGEHNVIRKVSKEEVQAFKKKITDKYKSPMVSSFSKALNNSVSYYFKYKFKYLYFYLLKYKLLGRLEYDYISTPHAATVNKLTDFFSFKYFSTTLPEKVSNDDIYIPMHYHPEATIEYWASDTTFVDYLTSLIEVVRKLSDEGFNTYLKEHPAMCFRQDKSIYKKLLKIKNVKIINPYIETDQVLDKFNNVAVWTGSTGIEALLNDKKVYFISSNYYFSKKNKSLYEIKHFENEEEKDDFVEYLLSNTIVW